MATLLGASLASTCYGFRSNGRWQSTATDGVTAPLGDPITLTWSIVPDGTTVPSAAGGVSDLIGDLGLLIGTAPGGVEQQPWFPLVQASFDRWAAISGVELVYEPNDDGATHGAFAGVVGVRGDIRLAGSTLDGNGGTFAQAGFIPNADITIDTSDTFRFSNPTDNYFGLRNTLQHEIGHSLGLDHNESNTTPILMEAFASDSFEGPQFDDIRGAHYLYGDRFEADSPVGNDLFVTATSLGSLSAGQTLSIGSDVPTLASTRITLDQVDFVSIANTSDIDTFEITTTAPVILDLTVSPVGANYSEQPFFGAPFTTIFPKSQSDLRMELFDATSFPVQSIGAADEFGLAGVERLVGVELATPGEYLIQIQGDRDNVQFYELELAASPLVVLAGDYDVNSVVSAADYVAWRSLVGSNALLPNETASIGSVDFADYETWKSGFGAVAATTAAATVPEPHTLNLLLLLLITACRTRKAIGREKACQMNS